MGNRADLRHQSQKRCQCQKFEIATAQSLRRRHARLRRVGLIGILRVTIGGQSHALRVGAQQQKRQRNIEQNNRHRPRRPQAVQPIKL